MRGFSLLEFLVGSALFMILLLAGYRFLQEQQHLTRRVTERTRPEIESNYRMLVVRTSFDDSTAGFERDPLLAAAPVVFPDLRYGQQPAESAFSVAHPLTRPVRFVVEGLQLHIRDASLQLPLRSILLLSGPDAAGNHTWDYVRVLSSARSGEDLYAQYTSLTGRALPVAGTLAQIEMIGLDFRSDTTLYWVHPSGESSAFLAVNAFHSQWDGQRLHLRWRCGSVPSEFQVKP